MASEQLKSACHIGDDTNPTTDPWDERSTDLHEIFVFFFDGELFVG